jgi:hypothetical protein
MPYFYDGRDADRGGDEGADSTDPRNTCLRCEDQY